MEVLQLPLKGQVPPQRRPRRRREEMYGLWRILAGLEDFSSHAEGDFDADGTFVGR